MDHFITLVKTWLNERKLYMSSSNIEAAAKDARYLYTHKDYSSPENSVNDIMVNAEGKVQNFNLKISYSMGKLTVDYMDGSDLEISNIDATAEDITEYLESVVESAMKIED